MSIHHLLSLLQQFHLNPSFVPWPWDNHLPSSSFGIFADQRLGNLVSQRWFLWAMECQTPLKRFIAGKSIVIGKHWMNSQTQTTAPESFPVVFPVVFHVFSSHVAKRGFRSPLHLSRGSWFDLPRTESATCGSWVWACFKCSWNRGMSADVFRMSLMYKLCVHIYIHRLIALCSGMLFGS